MRILIIVILSAFLLPPLFAAECGDVSGWTLVRRSQTLIGACFTLDKPTDDVSKARMVYTDNAAHSAEFTSEEINLNDADTNGGCVWSAELTANTTYLIDFQLYDDSDAAYTTYTSCQPEINTFDCNGFSNCDIVDAATGGAGDGNGGDDEVIQITTSAGTGVPSDPIAPIISITESLANTVDGDSDTVTCAGGVGSNFQALLTAAGSDAAGDGATHEIVIPAGCAVRPDTESTPVSCFTWPDPSPGYIKIRSNYPDTDAEPPVGGQIDMGAGVGAIELATTQPGVGCDALVDLDSLSNYQFEMVKIGVPPWADYAVADQAISGVSGSPTVITTTNALDRDAWGDGSHYLGIAQPELEDNCFRMGQRTNANSVERVTRTGGAGVDNQWTCSGITDPNTGSATGTGYVYNRLTTAFSSCTKASQPVCTTAAHPFLNGYQYALTSITASTDTALVSGSAHQYIDDDNYLSTYWVQGTTGGCDGFYEGNAGASGTIVFEEDVTGDCTGGTIEQVMPVWVHGLQNAAIGEAMSCLVSFESTTTVKLLKCIQESSSFTPDFTSDVGTISGYFANDPWDVGPVIQLNGASDIVFDRVFFDCGGGLGDPWRCGTIITAGASSRPSDILITGSVARGFKWRPINPHTGKAHADERFNMISLMQFIVTNTGTDGVKVHNSTLYTDGYAYFHASAGPGHDVTKNMEWSGFRYRTPDWMNADTAAAGGRTGIHRQAFEFKIGGRYLSFDGMSFEGVVSNGTAAPYAILCQGLPDGNVTTYYYGCSDIDIQNSYFGSGFAISMGAHGLLSMGSAANPLYGANERIKVNNNLFNPVELRTDPSGEYLQVNGKIGTLYPNALLFTNLSEFQFTNNTTMPTRSSSGFAPYAQIQNAHTSSVKWDGNLHWSAHGSSDAYDRLRCNPGGSVWATCVEDVFKRDGAFSSYADFSDNLVVAAGQTALDFDFDATNSVCTTIEGYWEDGDGYETNFPLQACTDSQSANTRFDAVTTAGTMKPTVAYGATIDNILDSQGRIRDVVHYSSNSAVRVTYTAPNTGSCILSYGVSPVNFNTDTDISALSASSGSKARTETITGLSGSTVYDYKISCADGGSVLGRLTTQ